MKKTNYYYLFMMIIGMALCACNNGSRGTEVSDEQINSDTSYVEEPDPILPFNASLKLVEAVRWSDKTKYSFAVKAMFDEQGTIAATYVLFTKGEENKPVATSQDGKFINIPASNAEGCYTVKAFCEKNPNLDILYLELAGFEPVVSNVTKMTVPEMQKLVAELVTGTSGARLLKPHPQIAKNVALNFSNIQQGDPKPVNFTSIQEKITMGDWSGVNVTSLSYNDKGQISGVVMQIKY